MTLLIKKIRKKHDISQHKLALAAKMYQPHIWMLENGKVSNPAIDTIKKVAQGFRKLGLKIYAEDIDPTLKPKGRK